MVDSKDMRYILNCARIHSSLPSQPDKQSKQMDYIFIPFRLFSFAFAGPNDQGLKEGGGGGGGRGGGEGGGGGWNGSRSRPIFS